jgi:hypothetical protein
VLIRAVQDEHVRFFLFGSLSLSLFSWLSLFLTVCPKSFDLLSILLIFDLAEITIGSMCIVFD